jgi:hypothetical protein
MKKFNNLNKIIIQQNMFKLLNYRIIIINSFKLNNL